MGSVPKFMLVLWICQLNELPNRLADLAIRYTLIISKYATFRVASFVQLDDISLMERSVLANKVYFGLEASMNKQFP